MKVLFLLAIVTAACLGAAAPCAGPVADWDFNGNLNVRAGATQTTLQAANTRYVDTSEVPGVDGKALALAVETGDTLFLTAPASDAQLGASYTIEAWIHPTQLSEWNRIALQWGAEHAYHLALHQGRISLYHGQADGQRIFAEGGSVQTGCWYHIAGVARRNEADPASSTLEVYLNGQRVGSAVYDGTIRTLPNVGLGIGDAADGASPGYRYQGYLDGLTLWNRALAPEDIRTHYAERADILAELNRAKQMAAAKRNARARTRCQELGVNAIIFAERHPGRDISFHYYANFGYSCGDPNYWMHGADGSRLCKLDLHTGLVTALLDDPNGAVRDPRVHYDAQRILFSYRKGGTHHYNLYEINIDGTGLHQLTEGPWDDIEPAYLPDGGIVFCSSRCKRYIGCWLAPSAILFRCDGDGSNIRMLSSGAFTENTPSVLPDGRVLYTRWEYVNRDPVVFHHLWTMNPDGTNPVAYFGNMHPGGVFIDAQPIRDTEDVVLIHSPGHGMNEHQGHVATLNATLGPDEQSAMQQVSKRPDYRDVYPLSRDAFLVAQNDRILLMDAKGRTRTVHQAGLMVHEPRPLIARAKEAVIAPRLDLRKDTGTLVLTDVYIGRNMEGVARGSVKKLLVLEDLPKPANFHGGGSQPIGHGVTSTLKRILGTVPVESDGSAHFEVPALRSIYFAALDENDHSIKQMRTFVTLQPGEHLSCVGCHESRPFAPATRQSSTPLALNHPPSIIEPFDGIPAIPDFPRDVQPILDKHCVKCHNHADRKGNVVLAGDRGPVFSHSYYTLLYHWQIKDTAGNPTSGTGRQLGNDKPYTTYSSASALMNKIDGSHHKVTLTKHEQAMVRLWIDVNAQYPGTYAAYGTGQVGGCWGNNEYARVMADDWPSTAPASDAVTQRCTPCHGDRLPKHVTGQVPLSHADFLSWERPLSRFSRHRIFNLTRPEKSLALLAPLARDAGGYAKGEAKVAEVKEDPMQAPKRVVHPIIFKDTADPDYQAILTHIQAACAKLDEIKRFDMPGFKPNEHYVREMKRFDILPDSFDLVRDDIDVYDTEQRYWASMWHQPADSAQ